VLFRRSAPRLQYAHERHVFHRDIKTRQYPGDRRGRPQLLDFGIAKVLNRNCLKRPSSPR